jgi:Na+/proline symporter
MLLAAAPAANSLLGMHWLDWAVLAVYFVVIVVIGWWSLKKVKDMSDFFMGGRRFGKVFMMFFAFGAGTSSEQAISVVAGTWRVGLAGIWWQFLWLWATPFYWIVAPVMRRMRALTTADFFEHRYNTSTATLYSFYGIIMAIVFIAGGLFSSGKMVNALTGGELDKVAASVQLSVPAMETDEANGEWVVGSREVQGYEFAILAMTVLFVAYGMAGGLGAAIITDFIQGVLTIAFSFLLLPFVFMKIGGFGQLHTTEPKTGMFDLVASADVAAQLGREPITIFYVFMLSLTALCGIVVQPHIMGVCGAGKTEFEGRFGFTVGNFLKRFCTLAWTFTGLACIVWYLGADSPLKHNDKPQDVNSAEFQTLSQEEQDLITNDRLTFEGLHRKAVSDTEGLNAEEIAALDTAEKSFADDLFGRAAYEILPGIAPGLVGLLLASLLAAVMSTSDAQMIVGAGLFTENIYKRFLVKNGSQSHYLWAGRVAGLVIVILAIMLQSSFTDVIDALKVIIKTPAAIGISLWFGIVWRRWTWQAVWASTFAAVGAWWLAANHADMFHSVGVLDFMLEIKGDGAVRMMDAWQMFSYISAGVIVGIVVSLITPRQPKEKLDQFFSLIHTPVTLGEEVASPCTLPENPAPQNPTMFSHPDIELPRPTLVGLGGFAVAWCCVGFIIWLTSYLAKNL